MNEIGVIREFRTRNFRVVVDAVPDYAVDLSLETGEAREKLETGEWISFIARVRVFLNGLELGSDYLGSCIYASLDAFQDHRECGAQNREYEAKGESVRCGSYFHDMVREAIAQARETLRSMQSVYVRQLNDNEEDQ